MITHDYVITDDVVLAINTHWPVWHATTILKRNRHGMEWELKLIEASVLARSIFKKVAAVRE